MDPIFPEAATSLQALLDRDSTPNLAKYLIVIAPTAGSDGHLLRRNAREEYDDLTWQSLPGKLSELDVACSGILVNNGMKQEQGVESPVRTLLGKVCTPVA